MDKRRLGTSDLHITPLGIGTWALGGPLKKNWGWGPQSDEDSLATIERALDLGINWIDTAPVYGIGHGEEVVGRFLKRLPKSTRPLVFTKCSVRWDSDENYTFSLKEPSLRGELENSLRRLGVETVDLYQIHWPSYPPGSPYKVGIEEAIAALSRFRNEGKIREIGVSNFDVAEMKAALSVTKIASLQPQYSLIERNIEREVLPFCAQQQIGVLVYSPMHSGLLSGTMTNNRIASLPPDDWRKRNPDFQEPKLSANLEIAERVRRVAARHGCAAGEIAVAWTLRDRSVTAAIVGSRRPGQLDDLVGAWNRTLNDGDVAELERGMGRVAGGG